MGGTAIYLPGKWKSQTFTSNGSFTVPQGVDVVFVELYGAGGGGGDFNGTLGDVVCGGQAGQLTSIPVSVTPGASVSISLGLGGGANTSGADSTFGSIRAAGGKAGSIIESAGYTPNPETHFGTATSGSRAVGGSTDTGGSGSTGYGGEGGYGAGGNGGVSTSLGGSVSPGGTIAGANGGLAAGGGAGLGCNAGSGGNGVCVVYWKDQ